ncbi:DASH complex subunit DAD2 [Golovinomyces cichoracearum]|uniref:DASH complex subunit DAD2 n=1 Tax=Golovinomyces cichoracearum TaxID=62708 RepID=A0A420J8Q0_9PEZI|nr:DASH complex subunit DAD2 [Golovinomyces cichoracearum]
MSNISRLAQSRMRYDSTARNIASTGRSSILLARICEKESELENLRQLRDLSASLAGQMEILEEKLATLTDGTEVVATVLGNWQNVLQAINMASRRFIIYFRSQYSFVTKFGLEKLQKSFETQEVMTPGVLQTGAELPQTLVRIPTENK